MKPHGTAARSVEPGRANLVPKTRGGTMHIHQIGIADSIERVGPHFDRHDLLILAKRSSRARWWRSPLTSLEEGGVARLGGVAVVWGEDVAKRAESLPDPVVVAVSALPAPKGLHDRIEWVQLEGKTAVRVHVESHPGSAEVRVFDLLVS